jgi:putative nucleotidyltransferase with HDIG domain
MLPRTLVQDIRSLMTLPEVALRVNELLNNPQSSNRELEEVIRSDPALTAKLLKWANSPYFGGAARVETISRAVVLIGRNQLRNMVLTLSVAAVFTHISPKLVDMDVFWHNSLACGHIAKLLARECGILDREHLFIAGLLHGIGKLVLYSQLPKQCWQVLAHKDKGERAMAEAELLVFGFTHAEVGAELLSAWNIPERLQYIIAHYLQPTSYLEYQPEVDLIHVASAIAATIAPSANPGEGAQEAAPDFDPMAWFRLGLDDRLVGRIKMEAALETLEVAKIVRSRG